ncbi:hypothetical protein [Micromonospora sp. DPT]|uniref:hypothetical protein n=1 Tax=Micromonospora sp. DPT TaxID=3142975 RepID=UPI0032086AAB
MSTEKDALRAARANEQRAREAWTQMQADDAAAVRRAGAALSARWNAAAEGFLERMKLLGFPGAVVVREYRRGVFARRPKYAAWKLWTPPQDSDSRTSARPYWLIIDGRLGHGSPEAIDLYRLGSEPLRLYLADEVLRRSVEALETMAASYRGEAG